MGSAGGWNRPAANQPTVKKGGAKAPSALKGIVAGLVTVCAFGGLFLWMFSGDRDNLTVEITKERGRIREVKSMSGPRPIQKEEVKETPAPVVEREKTAEEWKMPPTLRAEEVEDGLLVCEVPSNMPSFARNPYNSQVECLLSMLGKPGEPFAPLPFNPNEDLDQDFIQAMKNKIIIWEDESDASAEHKQMVNWLKKAVQDAQREGWKVKDLIADLEKERKHQWEVACEAQEMVNATQESDPRRTAEVREAVNKLLEDAGVAPIEKTETEKIIEESENDSEEKN